MRTSKILRLPTVLATAAAMVFFTAVAAQAGGIGSGNGDADDSGLNAQATIHISGQVQGGGSAVTASAPALCWWERLPITTADAADIALILQVLTFGLDSADIAAVKQVMEDEKKTGKDFDWYTRKTSDSATPEQLKAAGCDKVSGPYQGLFVGYLIRPFEPGNPPEPRPDPKYMAEVAMKHIDIDSPALDWNPKAKSLDGGTLVNLPTWFWVTNPDAAIGDENGERSVTATAGNGDDQVTVTVTAKASDLQITSPGGTATCPRAKARTPYTRAASDSDACTLSFERASTRYPDGFPVRSTVSWSASWVGSGPGVPGGVHQLAGITESATSNVPVRESQSVVTGVS